MIDLMPDVFETAFLKENQEHLHNMIPHTIIDALLESEILTQNDVVNIKAGPSHRHQNNKLVEVLKQIHSVPEEQLRRALCNEFCNSLQVCLFIEDIPRSTSEPRTQVTSVKHLTGTFGGLYFRTTDKIAE